MGDNIISLFCFRIISVSINEVVAKLQQAFDNCWFLTGVVFNSLIISKPSLCCDNVMKETKRKVMVINFFIIKDLYF
jgi:small basic protein